MPVWTCEFLKQQFLNTEYLKITSSKKRIYITRKLAKSRRLLNEEEILNFLQLYSFESVISELMSVEEQAVLFSQSEIIISPYRSGLTNLVFCQPGTKVIELFSPNYV
jgi:capsular polysaccharide biosynthesis protein